MRNLTLALSLIVFTMTCSQAFAADADNTKRIAQCIKDNEDEDADADVAYKYCQCMSGKMGLNETQSITQWEKSHPAEEKDCDEKSGWN